MLAQQRQVRILSELRRTGAVRVADLTEMLGVSDMTVRRDLEQLAAEGLARKVHGGAVIAAQVAFEPGFAAKSQVAQPTKQAIAERAAAMISPGAAIAVSAGTTTWAMAQHIAAQSDLTVVTNSTTVADAIAATSPFAVDTASGTEVRPGVKDPERLRAFAAAVAATAPESDAGAELAEHRG